MLKIDLKGDLLFSFLQYCPQRSDGGSLWRLLCSLVHPKTQHLKSLFGAGIVYLQQLQQVMSNGGGGPQLLAQGCFMLTGQRHKWPGLFPLGDVNRGKIWNSFFLRDCLWYFFYIIKNNEWMYFYRYRPVVVTHCGHTTMFKHLIKVKTKLKKNSNSWKKSS